MYTTVWVNRQELYQVGEKSVPKGYTLYSFIYMTFMKWQNYTNGKQIWLLRSGRGGRRRVWLLKELFNLLRRGVTDNGVSSIFYWQL